MSSLAPALSTVLLTHSPSLSLLERSRLLVLRPRFPFSREIVRMHAESRVHGQEGDEEEDEKVQVETLWERAKSETGN